MSLHLETATLAEGSAVDSRGNLTLVGFNPQLLVYEELPILCSPTFVVIAEEENPGDSDWAGRTLRMQVKVEGPDGDVLFLAQSENVAQRPKYSDLPARLQMVAQIAFTATKVGDYRFTAEISVAGDPTFKLEPSRNVRIADVDYVRASGGNVRS